MQDGSKDVGLHRRALRVRRGFTQRDVAEAAAVDVKTVIAAEKGQPMLDSTIRALAAAVGVSPADYLGPEAPVGNPIPAESRP